MKVVLPCLEENVGVWNEMTMHAKDLTFTNQAGNIEESSYNGICL